MPLINEDQIEDTFLYLKLGIAPFATTGALRLGPTGTISIRNNADDGNLTVLNHAGPVPPGYDDSISFADVFSAWILAGVGQSAHIVASNDVIGGHISLLGGDGETEGGDILLDAGNASESGPEGGGSVTILGGHGVDAGGVIGVFAGDASADSTAGAGIEIGSGIGKGEPVSSIQFLTAGSQAVASAAQTSNLRGTMADDVFTWDGVFKLTPRAFADLPATPTEGMMAWVNDSNTATWGATVAAGGANKVLVVYNGTDWTVAAK